MASNFIRDLYEDNDGVLWIATQAGVSRLADGIITNMTSATHDLSSNDILALTRTADGALWIGTLGKGLIHCQLQTDASLSCSTIDSEAIKFSISSLLADADGALWIGTNDGLARLDAGSFTTFSTADGLPGNSIYSLYRDGEGLLWIGTDAGLACFDGEVFASLTSQDGLSADAVYSLHRDADGILWVGTANGLSRIDAKAWRAAGNNEALHVANFSATDGLGAGAAVDIHRDRGGALWIAGGGLSRYDEKDFLHFTSADGLPANSVQALHRDADGVLWVATTGGLARLEKGRITSFGKTDGLPHDAVYAIHRPVGADLWLGTGNGISRFDGRRFTNFNERQGLFAGSFEAIQSAPDGLLWVAHQFGVYTYDGKAFSRFVDTDGLPNSEVLVSVIFRDTDDTMWVGTDDGLARYDGRHFEFFAREDGLAHHRVYAIYRDVNGPLWVGTDGGLGRYDGTHFDFFGEEDGVTGGAVYAIVRAPWGPLCMGTAGGLCLFDGESWMTLDRRDGLSGDRVYALLADPEGDLWLGSEGGLTRYRHQSSRPEVRLLSVQTDRLHTDLEALPPIETGTRVTLTYDALDLGARTGARQYRRRLVGVDGEVLLDWHNTHERELDIAFTEAGAYVFEVLAIARDLEYSAVAALALAVVPPWYARFWVVLFSGTAVATLVASSLFYARRYYLQQRETRQLRERMLDQERRARAELEEAYLEVQRLLRIEERTAVILRGWAHAVKSPLTIIRRQLTRADDAGELPDRVETIVDTVDRILGAAVDVQRRHFDLRSELNLLLYRTVQEYAGVEMQASNGSAIRLHADHAKLMMAFENLFRNACQALDGNGTVRLDIEDRGANVRVEVADDGPGIAAEIRDLLFEHTVTTRKNSGGTGLGLLITQHVIDAHGGRIWVESTAATGTAIRVELPHVE